MLTQRFCPQILVVVLGQDLPDEAADTAQQVFSLAVAAIGLAAFALVLALVEQVVLQILDDNVRRGSRVFEHGHVRPRHLCTSVTAIHRHARFCVPAKLWQPVTVDAYACHKQPM